ncbi:S8 family serine peptidase [Microbacterium sp. P04]|uniref:S8 family serine peptidase n=1 Tax=Microbacterium sp. P04 TaxID=3366947 RepID=UPI0037466D06
MADHLPLPAPFTLTGNKRRPPSPQTSEGYVFDARRQARNLRGVLEGLESGVPGLFAPASDGDLAEDDGIDASELGRIVLKITGESPFTNSGLGAWDQNMVQLGFTNDKAFYALSDQGSRAFFRSMVDDYNADPDGFTTEKASWLDALNNIANVELYDREDRMAPDLVFPVDEEVTVVDVSIWPTSVASRSVEKIAKERLVEVVSLVEAAADRRVQVLIADAEDPDRIFLRAQVDARTLDAILDHPLVERVRGPLTVEVRAEDIASAPRPTQTIAPAGAPIGIIDDLVVDANPWMKGVVEKRRNFPNDEAFGNATTHGTNVAAIAAWGRVADLLAGTVGRAPHPIYAARVAHANAAGKAEIVDGPARQVEDAMRWLHAEGARVVVFAFTQDYPDNGALTAELSAVVDSLANELGLVVVVSAGNLRSLPDGTHWKTDYPHYLAEDYSRVAAPGTAALALTVGSVAHSDAPDVARFPRAVAITRTGQAAPFSRTGPTSSGRQKPEFSGHGGSWAWNHDTDDVLVNDTNTATLSLSPARGGRLFSAVAGTSFAAPHVAHEVAKIATRYPAAGANLLRALTALSAQPQRMAVVQHGAYGVPRAENVLESGGNRAILVHEGSIPGNSYQVIELPVPDEFTDGSWKRELRVALAFNPAVRRSRRDYIACRLKVSFVRNKTRDEIEDIYREQATVAERENGAVSFDLPSGHDRPTMDPGTNSVRLDTVICRTFRTNGNADAWNVDDQNYFLIVEHSYSPWTDGQKRLHPTQEYGLAVEFLAHGQPQLDLHALTEARLVAFARTRRRARS